MAANEYYNPTTSNQNPHSRCDDAPPPPPPSSTKPPVSLYTSHQASNPSYVNSPYSATPPIESPRHSLYPSRDSYYSNEPAGSLQDERQYADNIPLKSPQARPYSHDDFPGHNTQYPPSPESQLPAKPNRSHAKKQGWFKGKITWVVYVTTLVQIGVFIGQLVENGAFENSDIQ
jgi:hypothetical protein